MDNILLKNAYDLCELVRCALMGETPQWEEMNLDAVHKLAKFHSLCAISYMALEGTPAVRSGDEKLFAEWKQEKEMGVRRSLLFTAERAQICAELEKMGCWYMPLKGSILENYYPKVGMRNMSDVDILYDIKFQKEVQEMFLNRGYKCTSYNKGYDDEYEKLPMYHYEMHRKLFGLHAADNIREYYEDIEKRLIPVNETQRKFSDEDFYIYFLAHGNKHFIGGGNGIRFLVDCWLYTEKTVLNSDYIEAELQKLGLSNFRALLESLAKKLFETKEPLTNEEEEAFAYCAGSGTYGTYEHSALNEFSDILSKKSDVNAAKAQYFLRRLWPDQRWFETSVPFFAKYRILKPFYILWRCVRGPVMRGKGIAKEIKLILNIKDKGEK